MKRPESKLPNGSNNPNYHAELATFLEWEDHQRVSEVQRRVNDTMPPVRAKGREFTDDDPKRGSQSPLGGRVW